MRIDILINVYIAKSGQNPQFFEKDKEMIHRPNSLHQLYKQNGYNWTIMHTALPCSFIADSECFEGRDLHILK